MKKLIFFIALILSIVLVLAGCGDTPANETPEKVETPAVENEVVVEEPEEVAEEIAENDDGEFVNPFADNNSTTKDYYYEVETITNEGSNLSQFWVSGNKSRMEMIPSETQDNVITILDKDEEVSYIYEPELNSVTMMDYDPTSSLTSDEGVDYIESLMTIFDDDGTVKVEKGTLDGETVQIITGNMFGEKNIMWISTKKRFPLKSEYYEDGQVVITRLFKNFSFTPVDQSLFIFTIPDGVEVEVIE